MPVNLAAVFTLLALLLAPKLQALVKSTNMSMLVMLAITGDEPRKVESCRIATNIALEAVNQRLDILPGYQLIPEFRDEGPNGYQSIMVATNFRRAGEVASSTLQAPVLVGVWFSGGCLGLAATVSYLNSVQSAPGCNHPRLSNDRVMYPNLYKNRAGSELIAYPRLRFIKEIGKWNRFGMLANSVNYANVYTATVIIREAANSGLEISYFDAISDIEDSVIQPLKDADIRVIDYFDSVGSIVLKFLCKTYKFGITGPKYAFILLSSAFIEPSSLPDQISSDCTKQIVYEQMKYSFWVGWASFTDDPEMKSTLGYSIKEFDATFLKMWNNNAVKPADFDKRFICHDSVLTAIMGLDIAEKKLKAMGKSLKNYKTEPELVMKVTNDSIAQVDFVGLREGRFRYSERLEPDDDTFVVSQWTTVTGIQMVYSFRRSPGSPVDKYSSYSVQKNLSPALWFTKDKKPPRDRRNEVKSLQVTPTTFFWVIVIAACLISLMQAIAFGRFTDIRSGMFQGKVLLTIGCLLFNVTAVLFAVRCDHETPSVAFCLQRILTVLAFACIQAFLFSRLLFHRLNLFHKRAAEKATSIRSKVIATTRMSTLNRRGNVDPTTSTAPIPRFTFTVNHSQLKKMSSRTSMILVTVSAIYLLAWVLVDPPKSTLQEVAPANRYDTKTDTFYRVQVLTYYSSNEMAWTAPLLIVHCLLLLLGSWFAYELRRTSEVAIYHDLVGIRIAVTNMTTLLSGVVLVYVVLHTSPVGQAVTLAIFSLLFSAATGGAVYWSLSRKDGSTHDDANESIDLYYVNHRNSNRTAALGFSLRPQSKTVTHV